MDKIIYYGHATIGLELDGHLCIIDPFFDGNPMAPISWQEVKPEFLLITHGHGDHIGDTQEIYKQCEPLIIANFEIIEYLISQGVKKVHAQHIGGAYNHVFGKVKLTNALHGSMLPDGSNGGNPAGFLITARSGKKIYVAGDTGLFGDMGLIGEEGIDIALLPIGDNYTMGPDDALRAVKLLKPKIVIPVHYNTWPIISQDPFKWANEVENRTETKVVVLAPGATLDL